MKVPPTILVNLSFHVPSSFRGSLTPGGGCWPRLVNTRRGPSISEAREGAAPRARAVGIGSNAQCNQHNNTDPDYQNRKRYGIIIEPVPAL